MRVHLVIRRLGLRGAQHSLGGIEYQSHHRTIHRGDVLKAVTKFFEGRAPKKGLRLLVDASAADTGSMMKFEGVITTDGRITLDELTRWSGPFDR